MPNETTFELNDKNETDQEKLNIRRIITGAEVYYNFTGKESCLNLNAEDNIGADMWDFQVSRLSILITFFVGITLIKQLPLIWYFFFRHVQRWLCQYASKAVPRICSNPKTGI